MKQTINVILVRGEKTTLFGYAWLWTGVLITPNTQLRSGLYLRKTIKEIQCQWYNNN